MPSPLTSRRAVVRLLLAVGVLLGAALAFGAGPAGAHAVVVSSDPADGASVATVPKQVTITFDESVGLGLGYLRVVNSTGRRVDDGSAFHPNGRGDTIAVALRSGLPADAYLASYRVLSADSHPVNGSIQFAAGGAALLPPSQLPSESTTDATVSALLDAARAVTYLGLAAAGGWWLIVVLMARRPAEEGTEWPRRARWLVGGGLILALVGAVGELLLQGPYAAGTGLGGLGRGSVLGDTLASSYGVWHLVQIAATGMLALLFFSGLHADVGRHPRLAVGLGGALWLVTLVAVAGTGHAVVQEPVWLGQLSTVLHLVAVTVWLGGLGVLGVSVLAGQHGYDDAERVLPTFSQVALGCVIVIAGTGTYQAWRELGSWAALYDTTYGQLILTKIGLFLLLIALGGLARWQLWRGPDDEGRHRRLRLGVLIEIVLAVSVLGVTAVLVSEPPGRTALAAQAGTDSATVTLSPGRTLTAQAIPARAGPIVLALSVSGDPAVQSMTVSASLPSQSLGPIPLSVSALGQQRFGSLPVNLPVPGPWEFTVNVQSSEFDVVTAVLTITLR